MNDTELLRQVRDGNVHRSSDGRNWLHAGPGRFIDVTAQADALFDAELAWFDRNAQGWWALFRLTGYGERTVGARVRAAIVAAELTEADAELVVQLYRSGVSMRRTARTFHTGVPKIKQILADAGEPLRGPGRSNREATTS